MGGLFITLQILIVCGTLLGLGLLITLAMPQSKLRSYTLEIGKYLLVFILGLLIVSPVDVVPDIIPLLGLGDDLAYLIGAVAAFKSAQSERQQRKLLP